jgi:hypothetical protein
MAVDERIAMGVQAPDMMSALSSGLETGERLRTRGMRDELLSQKSQDNKMSMEQAQQKQAMQGVINYGKVVEGLASIPDMAQRAKVLAQQVPMLEAAGIPTAQLTSMDLSDAGLKNVQAGIRPFLAKSQAQQAPSAIQTFDYYQDILQSDEATEEQKKAARIALKLEGGAKTFTPKTVDIGGSKYLQVGTEFFNPQTMQPVATDGQGIPISGGEASQLTPDMQRNMKAEDAASIASATTTAKIEANQGSTEALEVAGKKKAQAQKTLKVMDDILVSDNLDNITGITGLIPFNTGKSKDLLGQVQQMKSLLTADNLGIMTGVLSESDIKIIEGLSNDIRMKTDESGNITSIDGSYEGTIQKLKKMKTEIVRGLNAGGMYVNGQTITNPNTGERLVYRDGNWVAK